MKTLTSFLGIFFAVGFSYAQQTYYRSIDGKIVEEAKVKEQQQAFQEKYSKVNKDATVSIEIKDTQRTNDSIIHDFGFHIYLSDEARKKTKLETMIGQVIPKQNLKTIDGSILDFDKLIGKPTLLNFWFAKCKPCVDEMPVLNELKLKYGDKVNFVAITYEARENVKDFLGKRDFEFLHIADAQGYIDQLEIQAFPVNLILDKNLRISSIESGIPYVKHEDGRFAIGEANAISTKLNNLLR